MTLNHEALRYLREDAAKADVTLIDVEDKVYVALGAGTKLIRPPADPTATALRLSSLDSLVGYLTSNKDALDLSSHTILVESATSVRLFGPLFGRERVRETPVTVAVEGAALTFEHFYDLERFRIYLMAQFTEAGHRNEVIAMLSRVTGKTELADADDGIAQKVTLSAGTELLERARITNPVMLAPYRTFREVEQPVSPFVLRVRGDGRGDFSAALFEGDGGAWELEAVDAVAAYLEQAVAPLGVDVIR